MTSDIDIYRAAHLLVKNYGDDAPVHAAVRIDELMERGDLDGRDVWRRILRAVDELLAKARHDGAKVH